MADAEYTVTTKDGAEFTITAPEGTPSEEISKRARAVIEGTAQTQAEASRPQQSMFSELTEQAGVGLAKAGTALAGMQGDIREVAKFAEGKGQEFLGLPKDTPKASSLLFPFSPTSQQTESTLEYFTGKPPEPSGLPGQYARTFGEFLPAAFGGEGNLVMRIGRALFGSMFSETGGQVAKQIMPGSPLAETAGRVVGALTPTTFKMLWRQAPDRMEKVVDDLYTAASKNYQHADVKAIRIKPSSAQLGAMNIANDLKQNHAFDPETSPATSSALTQMLFQPSKHPLFAGTGAHPAPVPKTAISVEDIQPIRSMLRVTAGRYNPTFPQDQIHANEALHAIDDWFAKLKPNDLLAGDITKATPRLMEARGDYWAAKSMEALGEKLYAGELRASGTYSGQNLNNVIRQNVRGLLLNKKAIARYTPEERDMLEKIVSGTAPENAMRTIRNLLPRHGALGAAITGTAVAHLGPMGLAIPAVGEVAHALETKFANKLIRDLQETMVKRSPLGQSGYQLPAPKRPDVASPLLGTYPAAAGAVSDYLQERRETPQQPPPTTGKQSSLNPDEGRVVSDVDERPIAGQQYAMMNEDDLRNPLGRRPLATPIFGGPGAPSKSVNQLPPVQPRPANQNVKAPRAANQNAKPMPDLNTPEGRRQLGREINEGRARFEAGLPKATGKTTMKEVVEGVRNKEPKSFLQRIFDNTKGMSRDEILQSEPIWGGARQLAEGGKMSFKDAFHLLVEQRTGYGLTPQEWSKIAQQAMEYGIR